MKYIEKNFENADVRSFSDDEIKFINQLLKELIDNESVEGVFLIPIAKEEEVCRSTNYYCKAKLVVIARKSNKELKYLRETAMKDFNISISNKRYLPVNEINTETIYLSNLVRAKKDSLIKLWFDYDLVSSYIMFDRNGIIGKLQDDASKKVKPWKVARIINLDKLITEEKPKEKPRMLSKEFKQE